MSIATVDFSGYNNAPVMNYPAPQEMKVLDLSDGMDEEYIRSFEWGIGKYNEKRQGMYTASQFGGTRNIHMGIDIWTQEGRPVFSFYDGTVIYKNNNDRPGDYGPTLVLKHQLEFITYYALYGHLSEMTLQNIEEGEEVKMGQQIGTLGTENENGDWPPHLHFQLSNRDPGQADMPGVVAEEEHEEALDIYPDPRKVLGPLY
jgi:murein DD-endopeptidase MepM/ murein hydrolase activator NlpD